MSMSSLTLKSKLAAALMGAAGLCQAASPATLPIAAGTYVVVGKAPCKDAPLAGVTTFDGRAFLGPHSSDCTSTLLGRHGRSYRVSTECRALGDGTPATPFTQVQLVRVDSRTRFAIVQDGHATAYARCPSFR